MIEIIYTKEEIMGEPGPNLYWRGQPQDYLLLLQDMHCLGVKNDQEVNIDSLHYITKKFPENLILKSSEKSNSLFRECANIFIMDLDRIFWREILLSVLSITFDSSHQYIEIDNIDLLEEANIIMESSNKLLAM